MIVESREIATRVLTFADARGLLQAGLVNSQWCAWAEGKELWQPLVNSQWPATATLCGSGLAGGRFKSLYLERIGLEHCLRTFPPPDRADATNYAALVELRPFSVVCV